MNSHRPNLLAAAAAGVLSLSFTSGLSAQIAGNVSGTLPAGTYVAQGHITVPLGQTWTLSPGVVIKFPAAYEVTVNGTLIANGQPGIPITFTDIADDTVGGNTNGGGASVGSPGAWRGIVFSSTSSASYLAHVDARYGGSGYVSNFHLNGASPTFMNCQSRHNYTHGMQLNGNSYPTVVDCSFLGNNGTAVAGVPLAAVPGFTNNFATGNGGGNYMHVTTAAVTGALSIEAADVLGGALMVAAHVTIPAGAGLTLQPGVIFKFTAGYEVTVDGTLTTNGTTQNPVIFTDDADDSAGGDTNNNGPSNGAPGSWRGLVFSSTGNGSVLNWTEARYGGSGYVSNFHLTGASPTFLNCTSRNNYTDGMQLNATSFPTVTNCTFANNNGMAVAGVPLAAVPGFTNNAASGNVGNYLHVTTAGVTGTLSIEPADVLGGALMVAAHVTIPAGSALVLQAGTILKFTAGYEVTVNGTLTTNGTAQNPVILTDDADDSAGGDTNNNGPSNGAPGSWRGIVFSSTQTGSVLTWTEARYGGSGYVSNFHLTSASPTFVHCTSRNNYTDGMQLNASSFPTVTDCTFTNNSGAAVAGVPLTAVPGFTNNTASGNTGNYMHVTSAAVDGYLKIGPQSILNGALMVATHVTVAATGTLVVEQGVAFKFTAGYEVTVNGAIDLRGTGYEPIVFTDDADDSVAGDTNNNGASVGAPASWRGIVVAAGAGQSRIENVVIRYPGSGYVPGLMSSTPNLTVRSVRVDDAYDRGFALGALASSPTNLIAWSCGGYGIHCSAGAFDIVHATSTQNATGIRKEAAWSGNVHNSIAWGNTTNFSNFGTGGNVYHSNGGFISTTSNNLFVDPLFVDAPNGDLHLTASSPCLGLGQFYPAQYAVKDFDENSRMLDHALVGWPMPDMGAFELPAWTMAVDGQARPGSTLTFTLSGPPGDSFVGIGLLDGAIQILPYGMLTAGGQPGATVALLYPSPLPVGFPIPLPLVNHPGLIGIAAGIQTLTFPTGNMGVGNFTRLYRMLIRP